MSDLMVGWGCHFTKVQIMTRLIADFILGASIISYPSATGIEGWRGIVPLHATRADVERQLGPGTTDCKCGYYLKDLNVFFYYSSGTCESGGSGGWNIPLDTVLRIVVHPKPTPRFVDLQIDERKFQKKHEGHIERLVSYVNEEEGLIISVDEDSGLVMGLSYGPTQQDNHLRCPQNSAREAPPNPFKNFLVPDRGGRMFPSRTVIDSALLRILLNRRLPRKHTAMEDSL